ncbi:MAG: sensor histidine kinase, partial [Granulosicoccaceae bacterium]
AILAGLLAGSAWAQYVLIKSKTIPVVDWSITFEVFLSGVGFTAVALGIHYNYLRQTRIREKLWQAEKQQLEHSRELAQSELKALQAQIEPHFLFNSLASIRALIAVEPVMAERMLDHLSVLLRGVLQRSRSGSTSLAHELTLVKAYLDIQQIRLGSRLQYRIEAPDALTMDIEFPVLMLQPLVENAVGHGIEPAIEGGEVSVVVSVRQKTCTVVIEDTGVGLARDGRKGQGMALENVRARLDVLHGEGASLLVEPRLPQGTRCVLEVPVEQH